MTASVLLTGGAGFIGCTLAASLRQQGLDVVAVDNLHPQVHRDAGRPARLPDDVPLLPCDVTVPASWDAILKLVRPEVVVHLAAETGTGQSLLEASRHARVNVEGTTQMLDAFARHDHVPGHVVLTSSRAVYGEGRWRTASGEPVYPGQRAHADLEAGRWDPLGPNGEPLTSEPSRADLTDARPTNVYAATKLAQEHVCRAWTTAMGSALSVLRLQNVIGPGQALGNSYTGVLTLFARLALGGDTIDVYEDGVITRDFVVVDDVVSALAAAIATPPTGDRTLDVGSGEPATIIEAATAIAGLTGAPEPKVSGRFRDGDVRAAWCDTTRTRAELGWSPAWSLADGLKALVEWAGEHG
jgi:dTDP-L-rhamnose 4-epimerase